MNEQAIQWMLQYHAALEVMSMTAIDVIMYTAFSMSVGILLLTVGYLAGRHQKDRGLTAEERAIRENMMKRYM